MVVVAGAVAKKRARVRAAVLRGVGERAGWNHARVSIVSRDGCAKQHREKMMILLRCRGAREDIEMYAIV